MTALPPGEAAECLSANAAVMRAEPFGKADLNFLDPSKTRILLSEEKIDLDFAEREG